MCALFDLGFYYNNSLNLNPAMQNESVKLGIPDCFEERVFNGTDCKPFYDIWQCIQVRLNKTEEDVSQALDTTEICRKEFGVHEIETNRTFQTYKEKENLGCFVRCVNIKAGLLNDNVFTHTYLTTSFRRELRKMVIEKLENCHEETNRKFEEIPKYSCIYFYYYNECIERG